jgi:site-specific recombinase XerD
VNRLKALQAPGVRYSVRLSQDVSLEDVQYLAGHSNSSTTQIYDRRRRVTRNIVERILI